MAIVYPDFQTISKLRTPATEGEFFLLNELSAKLSSDFEIFFNPFLDGDRRLSPAYSPRDRMDGR